MLFKQLIEAFDIIDSKNVNGNSVASYLKSIKQDADIQVYPLVGPKGSTDMLKIRIPGLHGKTSGGDAPTIGLLGRLGGLGARPERIGYVSDGDSAAAFASYKFLIRFIISSFVSLYAYPVVIYKTFGRIHTFISGISIQSTKRTILSIPPSPAANVHPFDCASSNTSFTFIDTFYSIPFYLYYR